MKRLIVINGPTGVGKSTVAIELHKQIKPSYLLSCDTIRRFLNDYHDFPKEGRRIRNNVVLAMLDKLMEEDITVILEQLHTGPEVLDKYHEIAKNHGAQTFEFFLWVDSEESLLERFRNRQKGPTKHPNSVLTEERVANYWHTMKDLTLSRNKNSTINTTDVSVDEVTKIILKSIES